MRLISWNVNGLRSIFKKGTLATLLEEWKPDVLCLQETRWDAPPPIDGFKNTYFHNSREKKGYSGTSISCNFDPINVYKGFEYLLNNSVDDTEGRILTVEHQDFYIVCIYVINSKADLSRLDYRTITWEKEVSALIRRYKENKPVIMCGDFNVAHNEIDIYNAKGKSKAHGFTMQERQSFDKLLKDNDMVDTYRSLHPDGKKYSWWSNFNKSRSKNLGWRIDYFLATRNIKYVAADILMDHLGSDHAPLLLDI
jgi:exodeoxyribonuclease III